jgi:hypothetical protein
VLLSKDLQRTATASVDFYFTNKELCIVSKIFASMGRGWDDNMMRKALEKFFEKGLGVQMGVRVFRHFAVAVQREFPQTNYGIYKTTGQSDERRLAILADFMAGHTTQIEQHYARTASVVVGNITKTDFIRICQDWHTLHGFSTKCQPIQQESD